MILTVEGGGAGGGITTSVGVGAFAVTSFLLLTANYFGNDIGAGFLLTAALCGDGM